MILIWKEVSCYHSASVRFHCILRYFFCWHHWKIWVCLRLEELTLCIWKKKAYDLCFFGVLLFRFLCISCIYSSIYISCALPGLIWNLSWSPFMKLYLQKARKLGKVQITKHLKHSSTLQYFWRMLKGSQRSPCHYQTLGTGALYYHHRGSSLEICWCPLIQACFVRHS